MRARVGRLQPPLSLVGGRQCAGAAPLESGSPPVAGSGREGEGSQLPTTDGPLFCRPAGLLIGGRLRASSIQRDTLRVYSKKMLFCRDDVVCSPNHT